ncbi:MAG: hypothetical protein LUD46_14285 [Parabacteroides sp.]|nr:hypothetical protein [Parabacteroides sp.]
MGSPGEEAISVGYNDTAWRSLDLPHDWSIEGTYEQTANGTDWQSGYLPAGTGWYRKTFAYDPAWKDKKSPYSVRRNLSEQRSLDQRSLVG